MTAIAGHLLIVDDNAVDRERIRRFLGGAFATREAATAAEALALSIEGELDCVLLDYRLPDRDGIDLIDQLGPGELPVIMLTGQGDEHVAVEAMKRGACDYLVKSLIDAGSLRRAVENAIDKQRLQRRIRAQQAELEARLRELARRGAELEAANLALSEREARLRAILKQLPAVVWTASDDLRYTSMSGLHRVAGLADDEMVGREVGHFLDDAERAEHEEAHRAALEGAPVPFELRWNARALEGSLEPLRDEGGRVLGAIGAALDVTDTRQLQHQLQRSQKMEALGKLAGGVAHDFNNILTAILSFTGFAREELEPGTAAREDLDEVIDAGNRGAALVRQLLAFSRQRPVAHEVVDVNAILTALVPMLRRLLGEDVHLALSTDPELWRTRIDPGGLEQIVINMAVNARDAMARGGQLTISTERLVLRERLATTRTRAELTSGSYVVITIADEGEGIPPALQERIFEPFFTTKDVGAGTGLGLATCWGIAQQAGGSISVYSEVGSGTTFRVYLPRHYGPAEERREVHDDARATLHGAELVLVVEDDAQVRALTGRALRGHGYTVLEAATSEEAAAVVTERGGAIDLVLADVVMPHTSGPDLVRALRARLPSARVLFMSGYTGAAIRQRGLIDEGAAILQKPFTPEALLRKVREVLDRP